MRVLHWYPNFLGGGGVANAVLGLAKGQAMLGAQVVIASAIPNDQPLYQGMDLGPEVRVFEWQPVWGIRVGNVMLRGLSREARAELNGFNPNVVHIHGEFNPDNLWVTSLFDCTLVLSPHGSFHPVALRKSHRWGKKLYVRFARRWLYNQLRAFHAICPAEVEHIRGLMPSPEVYCLPHGPNVHVVANGIGSARTAPSNGEVVFSFVGRLDVYTKGLDLLLSAFACAQREAPHLVMKLKLVGPDWRKGRKQLEDLVESLGCAPAVRLTGALPAKSVRSEILSSDIYVQLSRHDGFPLAVAEALLLGKPAILSHEIGTTSFPQIRSLPHVRVVAPDVENAAQAMLEFARRRKELNRLAQENLTRVQDFFSWERVARAHLETYERLCS